MIRLRTFGSVDLEATDGRDIRPLLAQPKRLALLVYLVAARPLRVHRRDELLALFWPDLDDARARDALNQALRFLRQALGAEAFVRRGAEDIGIDPAQVWCDAVVFQAALAEGLAAEALELFRGDFLQGFFIEGGGSFEEWMERERALYRESAARGARELAERHAAEGGLTLAIDWGRRVLELVPDDERALRRLLKLHDRAGDRAGAFRAYEAFARRFEEEFGGVPSAETRALGERLRSGLPLEEGRAAPLPQAVEQPMQVPADPVSKTSEPYRIIRKLGAGGMAVVYLAEDVKHNREVALKVLRPEIAEGLARERFLREIRIAGRLQHPNIVPLFDSGEAEGKLYYVMPHVQGETLRDRLAREGALPIPEVIHILRELASALAHAHGQGVIHRDIKPANILLIDRRAVLADFGIARAAHAARTPLDGHDETLTQLGISLGTPAYMAPEQASGNPEIDHRADLYALGVVGYEMVAGRPPFSGVPEQIISAHRSEQPQSLTDLRPDTPSWLSSLLLGCLEKDPADRPPSAASVAGALEASEGHPSKRRVLLSKRARRTVFVSVVALAVLAALVLNFPSTAASPDPAAIQEEVAQLAVRPFGDLSADQSLGRIAERLAGELVSELARIPVLRVRSASVMTPLQRETPDSIRRVLGIGTLVEGSVAGEGDSLKLSVSIVRARTGDELAHQKWVVLGNQLGMVEDSLVAEMGRFVRDWLGGEIRSQQRRLGTRDVQAWEHYQLGSVTFQEANRLYRNGETVAAQKLAAVADSLLRQAEAGDPHWLDPILSRGWLHYWRALNSPSGNPDSILKWSREAIRQADRVLASRPDHAEARELRGTGYLQLTIAGRGDSTSMAVAVADLRRGAVTANPYPARAWLSLGIALRWQGLGAEANVAARQAYQLDPFMERADDLLEQLCATSFELGQFADATKWCTEGAQRYPTEFAFPYYRLQMMALSRPTRPSPDSAWALYRTLERTTPPADRGASRAGWQMMVAGAIGRAGLRDSARSVLASARRSAPEKSDLDVYDAAALVAIGDTDAAVERLRSYFQKHPLMRAVVATHPSFASLTDLPAFRDLVRSR